MGRTNRSLVFGILAAASLTIVCAALLGSPGHSATYPNNKSTDTMSGMDMSPAKPNSASKSSVGPDLPAANQAGSDSMVGMQMTGALGPWAAAREGSGTSWQPDASPMFMKPLTGFGGFDLGVMGIANAGYSSTGGKRGHNGFFSNSMVMLMAQKDLARGTLGLHFMTSLDPIIDGSHGNPNLFQNPFTVHGTDISDRKDPHNVFAEIAVSYSHPLSKDLSAFIYGGPVGEPALGNVMYLHRTSGLEIPEAPISHDWFDGSHISFGVATVGLAYQNKLKIEGSVFNSAEPGFHLYGLGKFALNSESGRLSYNPNREWSFSTSYGFIKSDANTHRFTLSAAYSRELPHGDNLSATVYFGQNIVEGSKTSNGFLGEATYYHSKDAYFARFETVDKDGLVDVPDGSFKVNKLVVGDVHRLFERDQLEYGIGAYVGLYKYPDALKPAYGNSPVTLGLFLRVRPTKN